MKKNIKTLCGIIALFVSAAFVCSCETDDENGKKPSADNSCVIAGALNAGLGDPSLPENYRFKYFTHGEDQYKAAYRQDGSLDYIIDGYSDVWTVESQNPLKFVQNETWSDGSISNAKLTVSFNGSGYISGYLYKDLYVNEDETEWERSEKSVKYEYNDNNQVTKVKATSSYTCDVGDNGDSEYEITNTYTGSILSKSIIREKYSWTDIYDGKEYNGEESVILSYQNPKRENTFNQYAECFDYAIAMDFDDILDCGIENILAQLGLFGRASSMFPSQVKMEDVWSEEDGDEGEDVAYYNFTFKSNVYGALSEETIKEDDEEDNGTYVTKYYYTILNSSTKSQVSDGGIVPCGDRTRKVHSPYRHHSFMERRHDRMQRIGE